MEFNEEDLIVTDHFDHRTMADRVMDSVNEALFGTGYSFEDVSLKLEFDDCLIYALTHKGEIIKKPNSVRV